MYIFPHLQTDLTFQSQNIQFYQNLPDEYLLKLNFVNIFLVITKILIENQYLDLFRLLSKKLLNCPLLEKSSYSFQKKVKMKLYHIEKFLSIYIVIFFLLSLLLKMKFQFHLNKAYSLLDIFYF